MVLGCVKTLRGMTAPGILRLVVTFRSKICRNLSSAQHYDQIRFRFYTVWTQTGRRPGRNPALRRAPDLMPANPLCCPDNPANGTECNTIK